MFFNGLPEMKIKNVTVKNVIISDAKEGAVVSQADGVVMENIKITSPTGNSLSIKNANNIKVDGILFKEVDEKGKTVIFK